MHNRHLRRHLGGGVNSNYNQLALDVVSKIDAILCEYGQTTALRRSSRLECGALCDAYWAAGREPPEWMRGGEASDDGDAFEEQFCSRWRALCRAKEADDDNDDSDDCVTTTGVDVTRSVLDALRGEALAERSCLLASGDARGNRHGAGRFDAVRRLIALDNA